MEAREESYDENRKVVEGSMGEWERPDSGGCDCDCGACWCSPQHTLLGSEGGMTCCNPEFG